MVNSCAYPDCTSNFKYDKTRSFFRFPADEIRCKKWVDATGRPELLEKGSVALHKSKYICDLHFSQNDRLLKKLRQNAVPIPYKKEQGQDNQSQENEKSSSIISEHDNQLLSCIHTEPIVKAEVDSDDFDFCIGKDSTEIENYSTEKLVNFTNMNDKQEQSSYFSNEEISSFTMSPFVKLVRTSEDYINMMRKRKQEDPQSVPFKKNQDDDISKTSSVSPTNNTVQHVQTVKKPRILPRLGNKEILPNKSKATELRDLTSLQNWLPKIVKSDRYARAFKLVALNLYLSSPRAYRVMRGMLNLPTVEVLRHTSIDINTSISTNVIRCLETKMGSMKELERTCTICISKTPLRRFLYYQINRDKVIGFHDIGGKSSMEPATLVYAVMARGISYNWMQPLGYCCLVENKNLRDFTTWLDDTICEVMNIGFNVVALITDHEDSALYNYAIEKNVSCINPFFHLKGKKIYFIFDVPRLVISLRNILMQHEFQFHDDDGSMLIANWGSIVALFLGHKELNNRSLVPKLTKTHVCPIKSERKELKYAAQVFSKSVSEALDIQSGMREDWQNIKVIGTAKLTGLVNDVFDILNSSTGNDPYPVKNAFTGETFQIETLDKFLNVLNDVSIYDDENRDMTDNTRCLNGLKVSVTSIRDLSQELRSKGMKSLLTHRFNLHSLDSFFDSLKQKHNGRKPTAIQFYKSFRRLFMGALLKCPKTANHPDDLTHFLGCFESQGLSQYKIKKATKTAAPSKTIRVGTHDYRANFTNNDAILHTCEYLLKNCMKVHKCEMMNKLIHASGKNIDWKNVDTTNTRSWFTPPESFMDLVRKMDRQFNEYFGTRVDIGIGNSTVIALKEITFDGGCSCFPMAYVVRLFLRFRLYHILKYNNKHLRNKSFKFNITDNYVL